jgi:hypothetical protein
MVSKEKCNICNGTISNRFFPMDEWDIKGPLCGECYSKKIDKFYPGTHVRVNKKD